MNIFTLRRTTLFKQADQSLYSVTKWLDVEALRRSIRKTMTMPMFVNNLFHQARPAAGGLALAGKLL